MVTTTMPVAVISAGRSRMPSVSCSQRANGAEKAASPTMPLRMLIEVMPICTTESHLVGSSCRAIAWTGARIPRLDHDLKPRLAAGGERHLRHGEQGVQEDQEEQQGNVHARAQRCRAGSVAESTAMDFLVGDLQGCADALDRLLDEDRLLAVARPDLRARRPRQSRPRLARRAAPAARPRRRRALRARQPRLASARRRRRRAAAASQRHARRHPRRARSRGLARVAAPPADGGARARLADAACRRRAAMGPGDDAARSPATSSGRCATRRRASSSARCSATSRSRWSESLAGAERLRFTLNALTRIRFVTADGTLEFATKDGADAAPPGYHAVVRRARPPHRRHADRLRPLVDARPARPARCARPRHRLRLGRQAQRRAHRRRSARDRAGRLRRGARPKR